MPQLIQLDIASRNPADLASWYGRLFDLPPNELAPNIYTLELGACKLFFCPRQMAGVADEAEGTHQLNISIQADKQRLRQLAEETKSKIEVFSTGGPEPTICIWDPEGNPVVLHVRACTRLKHRTHLLEEGRSAPEGRRDHKPLYCKPDFSSLFGIRRRTFC